MANTAWITVEIAISTDCRSNREVDRDMALYIIPALEKAAEAIQSVKLIRTEEIHDETGRAIFKILPYRMGVDQ